MTELAHPYDHHLIGTSETAELLGWSVSKVKRAARDGRLPFAYKLDGRTGGYLFDRVAIIVTAHSQDSAA